MSVAIEVFVFKGAKFLGSRVFSQSSLTIGRGRDANLRLQDAAVEDRHAIVRLEGASLILADASQSGLEVNGERVRMVRITSLDEVAIGPFRIKLQVLGAQQEEAAAVFGDDEPEDAETSVQRVEQRPEPDRPILDQLPEREEATLPRIVQSDYEPRRNEFDDVATKAARPRALPKRGLGGSAREAAERARRVEYERVAEEPSAEDEFAQEQPTRKAAKPYQRPERPEARFSAKERLPHPDAATVRGLPAAEEEPEPPPEPEPEEVATGEDTSPRAAEAELEEPFAGELAPVEDDEDEEEEPWVEPFSLLENIVRERFKTPIPTESNAAIEVIEYQENEIIDLRRADADGGVRVGLDAFALIAVQPDRKALLYFQKDFSGTLVSKGKARPLRAFCNDSYLVDRDAELYCVTLQEGDYAQVLREGIGYLVRFVKPPLLPKAKSEIGFSLANVQAFVASAAFHFLLGVLFVIIAPDAGLSVEGDKDNLAAKISLKDLELEKAVKDEPKPEAKKDEPAPPKDVPKETKVVKKVVREKLPRVSQNVPLTTKQKEKQQKKAVANVMSALENLKPAGLGPGRSDLKALASNISAVRSPGGAAAGFKVSGVIGRIGGDGVRLAGGIGGGGGKDTRVGTQLLAGGTVGKIAAIEGTGKKVRGKVGKAPTRAITASGGTLSREAIQQVVSAHMHEVQACYERALLTSPGLAGKIVFDWQIAMGGGVSSARLASSSMNSPAVATCILMLIRTWRFPSPVGGAVDVRYPFVFRVQGF
jgi:outer membrane biosynthesis protein TonB